MTRPRINRQFPGALGGVSGRVALVALTMVLAGCAAIAPAPPPPVHYRCDGGCEFAVSYRPDGKTAGIHIAGMHFELAAQGEDGLRYGCNVLTLWRDAQAARVEMEGEGLYDRCRPLP